MEDKLTILSTSEPDEDGMINMEIEFENEEFFETLLKKADQEGLTVNEYISKALIEYAEKLKKENEND